MIFISLHSNYINYKLQNVLNSAEKTKIIATVRNQYMALFRLLCSTVSILLISKLA